MKKYLGSLAILSALCVAGCESNIHEPPLGDQFVLGAATVANIKVQSIRNTDLPNKRGIIGEASGERAVVAIDKLNQAKASGETDAQSVSTSRRQGGQ